VKKNVVKFCTFLIILIYIIIIINPIFILKTDHRAKLIQGLYKKDDSYDVVLMGSSHMAGMINPNELWNKYGITSFNYATGGQPIDVTYYLLKEVLKKHKKPIVVLDIYYLGLTDKFGQDGYIRYVIDNMKFSMNKMQAIFNSTPKDQWPYYIFPMAKYHTRWKELEEKDFVFDTESSYYAKGFGAGCSLYGEDSLSDTSTKGTSYLPPKTEEYLFKIIELCKENDLDLVLVNAPHDYTKIAGSSNWHEDIAKMYNKVAEIAKDNDIPFIDYNKKFDEIGFDFKKDMFNDGHANIWGSDKLTDYLGKFLKENYNLADHRSDKDYEDWNTGYVYYTQDREANILKEVNNIKDYVPFLKNDNYIIVVDCNNYSRLDDNHDLKETMKGLGLKLDVSNQKDGYTAVINRNKVELEEIGDFIKQDKFVLNDNVPLEITRLREKVNTHVITINGKEYTNDKDNLNILVYNRILGKAVDYIYVDDNGRIGR